MAEPNDKLSSLFAKKKKNRKSTTVNANVIAKGIANSSAPAKPAAAPAAAPAAPAKPAAPEVAATATGKKLSELTLVDKDESEDRAAFQWAKQPKKYKNMNEPEGVARTWEEQEERNRTARRIKLDSERAFPTLGADANKVQLTGMKVPEAKGVATKNVWASLEHDEDSD